MQRKLDARLRKALRRADHWHRGLQCAITRRERHGGSLSEALWRFAIDPDEKWEHRKFVSHLIWRARGAEHLRLAIANFAVETPDLQRKTEYLRLCPYHRPVSSTDLGVFQEVIDRGSSEDQISAIDELAFLSGRSVRRTLINLIDDNRMAPEVRERAIEMLHLQPSRETVDACTRVLHSGSVTLRFWATYTLGNSMFSRSGLGTVAASALESVLNDPEIAPGWWSVGREAKALLVNLREDTAEEEQLQADIRKILQDPNSSPAERRWAECYLRE